MHTSYHYTHQVAKGNLIDMWELMDLHISDGVHNNRNPTWATYICGNSWQYAVCTILINIHTRHIEVIRWE